MVQDSPGEALAHRHSVEEQIYDEIHSAVKKFIVGVENDAIAALNSDVILASLNPFTLSKTLLRWEEVTAKVSAVVAGILERKDPFMRAIHARLAKSKVPFHTHTQVANTIKSGIEAGQTQETLTNKILDNIGNVDVYAHTLARTTSTAAVNHMALLRMKQNGQKRKKWVAHHDGRTRSTHLTADGQVQLITDPFSVGGYLLEQPGDLSGPPEEVENCRCIMIGVSSSEENTDAIPPEYRPDSPVVNPKGTKRVVQTVEETV